MEYYTETQAKEFAKNSAKTIVVKEKVDGDIRECRRESTESEASVIEIIIFGCLLAVRENIGNDNKFVRSGYISGAKSSAEFIFGLTFDWAYNGYLSVYCPICDFLRDYDA